MKRIRATMAMAIVMALSFGCTHQWAATGALLGAGIGLHTGDERGALVGGLTGAGVGSVVDHLSKSGEEKAYVDPSEPPGFFNWRFKIFNGLSRKVLVYIQDDAAWHSLNPGGILVKDVPRGWGARRREETLIMVRVYSGSELLGTASRRIRVRRGEEGFWHIRSYRKLR